MGFSSLSCTKQCWICGKDVALSYCLSTSIAALQHAPSEALCCLVACCGSCKGTILPMHHCRFTSRRQRTWPRLWLAVSAAYNCTIAWFGGCSECSLHCEATSALRWL
jgi:hypothetical protein